MVLKLSCPTLYLYDTLTVIKYEAGIADPRSFLYIQTQLIFNSRFDFSLLDADISLCNSCAAVLQKCCTRAILYPLQSLIEISSGMLLSMFWTSMDSASKNGFVLICRVRTARQTRQPQRRSQTNYKGVSQGYEEK